MSTDLLMLLLLEACGKFEAMTLVRIGIVLEYLAIYLPYVLSLNFTEQIFWHKCLRFCPFCESIYISSKNSLL